jgi:hypothetical protein
MSTTVREVYDRILSTLSPTERLRLATLILNDLTKKYSRISCLEEIIFEELSFDIL